MISHIFGIKRLAGKTYPCYAKVLLVFLLFIVIGVYADAQSPVQAEPQDFETELNTPEIPNKKNRRVQEKMQQIAQDLIEEGFNVELLRDDQVVAITISLSNLFAPNSWELSTTSNKYLQPFLKFLRQYGEFKLLLTVHTDNTGSESYRKWICEQRVLSLYDYFDTHGATSSMIYGYPMGCSQPLVSDDSVNNRALNRRLEIYIVPGPEFIKNK